MTDVHAVSSPNYVTPAGAKKLADELRQLTTVDRPKVVAEVSEAAAQGDRSENAEYIYGKKRLREIDRRIRFLMKRLDAAVVVHPSTMEAGVVRFGATVEVESDDGQRVRYTIVGQDEVEPEKGRVSHVSPVGQALLRRKVGDVVTVRRPAGETELEILAIRYEG